jgi:hypothetical protein
MQGPVRQFSLAFVSTPANSNVRISQVALNDMFSSPFGIRSRSPPRLTTLDCGVTYGPGG